MIGCSTSYRTGVTDVVAMREKAGYSRLSGRQTVTSHQLRHQLARILPLKQPQPRLGHILHPRLYHCLALLRNPQRAILNRPPQQLLRLARLLGRIVQDDETPDGEPHGDDVEPIPHHVWLLGVVARDGAAGGDTAVAGHVGEHEVEDLAADVVVVDVHSVFSGLSEVIFEGGGFVVEA